MIWLKSCPRCRGDLQDNRDIYGCYVVCIQCGYYLSEAEEVLLRGVPSYGHKIYLAETGANAPELAKAH